ncbi:MAG TPA: hypothetical protein VE090_00655 [Methylomirabilota bacterium]|nr:hypothetical protein [Methylomirabilota bacterium]
MERRRSTIAVTPVDVGVRVTENGRITTTERHHPSFIDAHKHATRRGTFWGSLAATEGITGGIIFAEGLSKIADYRQNFVGAAEGVGLVAGSVLLFGRSAIDVFKAAHHTKKARKIKSEDRKRRVS